jgi:hypothetical protein
MDAQDGRRLAAIAAGTLLALGVASPAIAAPVVTTDAGVVARAIVDDEATLTGAAFTAKPTDGADPAPTAATFAPEAGVPLGGFPIAGADAGLLTTGDAAVVPGAQDDQPDQQWQDDPAVTAPRGTTVHDLTTLRLDLTVPAGRNCLALSYRFLSEEFPEYVGDVYNDAFIAELDTSTWTTDANNEILLPNDFATNAGGKPVSVNGVGPTAVDPLEAAGTIFDAATGLVTTKTQVTPGAHSVYLSIFDQTDHIYDSAVMLDRLAFITESPTTCKPPEVPVIAPPPPAPPASTAPTPVPPSNDITVPGGSVTFRNGSATITIQVPGPGTLTAAQAPAAGASRRATASAKRKQLVKPASAIAKQAGPVKLKLKPTKAGKKQLRKKGKIKLSLAVTFTPTGGTPKTEVSKLTIKAKKKAKKHG